MAQLLFLLLEHIDEMLLFMFVQFLEVVFKEWIRSMLKRGDTKKKAQAKDAKSKAEIPANVESPVTVFNQPTCDLTHKPSPVHDSDEERLKMARKFTLGTHQISVFAIIRDDAGRVLLSRRTDNGWFNLPGGKVEPGESVVEALIREVWEETGLIVQVDQLIGLYTKRKKRGFTLTFGARIVAGRLRPSDEADRHEWVAPSRLNQLRVLPRHLERTQDALRNDPSVILDDVHQLSLVA